MMLFEKYRSHNTCLRRSVFMLPNNSIPERQNLVLTQGFLSYDVAANEQLYYLMDLTKAAGLAAPQIGISLRVFAIQCPDIKGFNYSPALYEKRGMEHIPLQIWINPEVKVLDYDRITDEECCESMRGFSAEIPRFRRVLLSGFDETGAKKNWEAENWSARIVQHEMDHLDGKFFTDSMNPKSLTCTNWDAINFHSGRIYTTYMPKG